MPLSTDLNVYELLVDTVQDYAVFVLDPNGIVSTWNPGAENLKGYEADEIIGQHSRPSTPSRPRPADGLSTS
jgi:PAS domain S-box-containing protein